MRYIHNDEYINDSIECYNRITVDNILLRYVYSLNRESFHAHDSLES